MGRAGVPGKANRTTTATARRSTEDGPNCKGEEMTEIYSPTDYAAEQIEDRLRRWENWNGPVYGGCSFASFQVRTEKQMSVLRTVRDYGHNWPAMFRERRSIILRGPSRTGKGHLARAVCRHIIERFGHFRQTSVAVINARHVYGQYSKPEFSESQWMDRYTRPHLLFVEDPLGINGMTPAFADFIYRLLERRFSAGYPTCVTTNAKTESAFRQAFEPRNFNRLGADQRFITLAWEPFEAHKKAVAI